MSSDNPLARKGLLDFKSEMKQISLDFASAQKNAELTNKAMHFFKEDRDRAERVLRNEAAWATDSELYTAMGKAKHLAAAGVNAVVEAVGNVASLPFAAQAASLAAIPTETTQAYNTVRNFEDLPNQERTPEVDAAYKLLAEKVPEVDSGTSYPMGQRTESEPAIRTVAQELDDPKPLTRRGWIEGATNALSMGDKISSAFKDTTEGIVNPSNTEEVRRKLDIRSDTGIQAFKQGTENFKQGNYAASASEMLIGAGEMLGAMADIVADPMALAEYTTDAVVDVALYAVGGPVAAAIKSAGYSGDIYVQGVLAFEEREGRLPNQDEAALMLAASATAGAVDMLADKSLLDAISPAAKKLASDVLAKTGASALATGVKTVAGVGTNIAGATAKESITEGYQTLVEENLSSLDPDIDAKAIFDSMAIGGVVGGTLSAGGQARHAGVIVKSARDAFNAAKEVSASTKAEAGAITEAATSGDFTEVQSNPVSYVDALVKRNTNIDDATELATNYGAIVSTYQDQLQKQIDINAQMLEAAETLGNDSVEVKNYMKAYTVLDKSNIAMKEKLDSARQVVIDKTRDQVDVKVEVEKAVEGDTKAVEVLLGSFDIDNSFLSVAEAESLASSSAITPSQKVRLTNYVAYTKSLATIDQVKSMVVNGGKDADGNRFIGANEHRTFINNAVVAGDEKGARDSLRALTIFTARHRAKAEMAKKARQDGINSAAWNEYKQVFKAPMNSDNLAQEINNEAIMLTNLVNQERASIRATFSKPVTEPTATTEPVQEEVIETPRVKEKALTKKERRAKRKQAKKPKTIPEVTQPAPVDLEQASIDAQAEMYSQADYDIEEGNYEGDYYSAHDAMPLPESKPVPTTIEEAVIPTEEPTLEAIQLVEMEVVEHKTSVLEVLVNDDALPLNEQNLVKKYFNANPKPNVLNSVANFTKEVFVGSPMYKKVFGEDNPSTQFESYSTILNTVEAALGNIFEVKQRKQFLHEDFTQFLVTPEGKLAPQVAPAIAASIYSWILADAKGTLINDSDAINSILNRSADAYISKEEYMLLGNVGVISHSMNARLGKQALQVLQLRAPKTSPTYVTTVLEQALGGLTTGVMLEVGILQKSEVNTASLGDSPDTSSVDTTASFYKATPDINNQITLVPWLAEVVTENQGYTKLTDKLFGIERIRPFPAFEPIKAVGKLMKGTFQKVPTKVLQVLKEHQAKKHFIKQDVLNVFKFLDTDGQRAINGYEFDVESRLKVNRRGIEGKNASIDRELEDMDTFLNSMDTLEQPFYFKHEVWKNLRIGMVGAFNVQSSKIHRHVVAMDNWRQTVKLDDAGLLTQFKLAVAEGLDIGTDKLTIEDSLAQLTEVFRNPVIREGVKAIQSILNDNYEDVAATQQAIITATKAGGMKTHSLDALVNYAQYRNAIDQGKPSFEANLFREVDGITNGIAIATLQFGVGATVEELMTRLNRMGMFFDYEEDSFGIWSKDTNNLDTYKSIVPLWREALQADLKQLNNVVGNKLKTIISLVGNEAILTDTAESLGVSSAERGETKYPLLVLIYGSSDKAVENSVGEAFVEAMYTKIQKAIDTGDRAALDTVLQSVNVLVGSRLNSKGMTRKDFLEFSFDKRTHKALVKTVAELYGKPLTTSINANFEEFTTQRQLVNGAAHVAFEAFNRMYNHEVSKAITAKKAEGTWVEGLSDLTTEEYENIRNLLTDAMPIMDNYFSLQSGKVDEGIYTGKLDQERQYGRKDNPYFTNIKFAKKVAGAARTTTYGSKTVYANPGVSPTVLGVQGIDAATMLLAYENSEVLGVHDAIGVGIANVTGYAENINKSFMEVMTKSALISQALKMYQRSLNTLNKYDKAEGTNFMSEVGETTEKLLGIQMGGARVPKNNQDKLKALNGLLLTAAHSTSTKKKEAEARLTSVLQYNVEGGGYLPKGAKTPDVTTEEAVTTVVETATNAPRSPDELQFTATSTVNTANMEELLSLTGIGRIRATRIMEARETQGIFNSPSDLVNIGIPRKTAVTLGSSSEAQSINNLRTAYEFDTKLRVSKMNALEVFENLSVKGLVTDTKDHATHLRDTINNVVSKVLTPFDLYLAESDATETIGITTLADMYLVSQVNDGIPPSGMLAHGIRMSTSEAYVHELIHNVTYAGLRKKPVLRRQVKRVWEQAKVVIKPTDLMNGNLKEGDALYAEELEAATQRYDYIFTRHDHYLDEFLAFSNSNQNMMKALGNLSITEVSLTERLQARSELTLADRLHQILTDVFNMLFETITRTRGKRADAQMQQLLYSLANVDARKKQALIRGMDKTFKVLSDKVNLGIASIQKGVLKLAESDLVKGSRVSAVRAGGAAVRLVGKDNVEFFTDAVAKLTNNITDSTTGLAGAVHSVFVEGQGRTQKNGAFHDLKRIGNANIDQLRKRTMQVTKNVINEQFKRDLSIEEKVIITQAVRTDFGVLISNIGKESALNTLKNNSQLGGYITTIEKMLVDKFGENGQFYVNHAQNLGYFIVTERSLLKTGVLKNAHNISRLHGSSRAIPANATQAVKLIDTLASLYAVKALGNAQRGQLLDLFLEETDGMDFVVNMYEGFKENSTKELSEAHRVKGYTADITNQDISYRIGTLDAQAEYEAEGYIKGARLAKDPSDPSREGMYIYTAKDGGMAMYNAGIVNLASSKARGTGMYNVRLNAGDSSPAYSAANDFTAVSRAKVAAFNNTFGPVLFKEGNYTSPVFNPDGGITDWVYLMSSNTKDSYLERDSRIDEVLPRMIATLKVKPNIRENNAKFVDAMYVQFTEDGRSNPTKYVEVSARSASEKHREIWNLMPNDMKAEVKKVWGKDSMMVSKDMLDLAFGYRKYSATEILTADPESRNAFEKMVSFMVTRWFGKQAASKLRKGENIVKELVAMGKDMWIIKSFLTTLANTVSNLVLLRMRGVSVKNAVQDYTIAYASASEYKNNIKEMMELEQQLAYANLTIHKRKKMADRIAELKVDLDANPVKELIDNGALQTIVEDVETDTEENTVKGVLEEYGNKFTRGIPKGIKDAAKVALLMQGTKPYAFLRDAAQLSDFGARYALFNKVRKDGMSVTDAVGHTMHIFLDYDLPTHKMLQYGNDIGALLFTKYFIRVIKIMYETLRDYPAQVLSTLLLQNWFGDVTDIYDTGLNPLSRLGTPLDFLDAPSDIATVAAVM